MDTITQLSGTLDEQLPDVISGAELLFDNVITSTDIVDTIQTLPLSMSVPFDSMNIPFYIIVFFWLLVIVWVIKDSNYRSNSTVFVIFSLLLVTLGTPLLGLPIYLAIRPLGYKYERVYWKAVMTQEEEFEEQVIEAYKIHEIEKKDSDTDEDHLTQLKKQATVAKRRVTKTINNQTKSKETPKKQLSSSPKPRKPSPRNSK